jgi:hypothetical protein
MLSLGEAPALAGEPEGPCMPWHKEELITVRSARFSRVAPQIIAEMQITSNDELEQPNRLHLNELRHRVAENFQWRRNAHKHGGRKLDPSRQAVYYIRTMKIATVLESSEPVSMIQRHNGMISVERRKCMTDELLFS